MNKPSIPHSGVFSSFLGNILPFRKCFVFFGSILFFSEVFGRLPQICPKKPIALSLCFCKRKFFFHFFAHEVYPEMTYTTPLTAKFSDKSVDDIEKAARKLGIPRSTLMREVLTRYLPDYLFYSLGDRDRRRCHQNHQRKIG